MTFKHSASITKNLLYILNSVWHERIEKYVYFYRLEPIQVPKFHLNTYYGQTLLMLVVWEQPISISN